MMFLRSVVLGSAWIVAFASASSLEQVVDDADGKVRGGATLETISQCPATKSRSFHHDGLQKDQLAEATFPFDPPRDGCYIIEERTALDGIRWQNWQKCKTSANTKVHVHYCKGKQAVGTVDQTPKGFGRQPQDQWTFIAALPFYAGHRGNVTLSNKGTEPGTLTVFDQVRFSWSGSVLDCIEADTYPRIAQIRMTVDFQNVADRLTIFGIALKKRLAEMAGVSEESLRLTDIRSGSIIAEFLVLPGAHHLVHQLTPAQSIERLRRAVSENQEELCALSLPSEPIRPFTKASGSTYQTADHPGDAEAGCNVEIKDLGIAPPTVKHLKVVPYLPLPWEESVPEQQENDTHAEGTAFFDFQTLATAGVVAASGFLLFALYRVFVLCRSERSLKTKKISPNSNDPTYSMYDTKVAASMEEGEIVEEKKPSKLAEEDCDKSTECDVQSELRSIDTQSERSDDIETPGTTEGGVATLSVVKVKSNRSQESRSVTEV